MSPVCLGSGPASVVRIETTVCWQTVSLAESQMPFSQHVGGVAIVLETFWEELKVGWDAGLLFVSDNQMLRETERHG